MKNLRFSIILSFAFAVGCLVIQTAAQTEMKPLTVAPAVKSEATPVKSATNEWLDVALEATAREHARVSPRQTGGSRMLMIITTSMYDAWAAYDDKVAGTRLGGKLRRPPAERTTENKKTAIAFATYRAMLDLFAEDKVWLDEQMRQRGFDPNDNTTDTTKPQGVGNAAAAAAVIEIVITTARINSATNPARMGNA